MLSSEVQNRILQYNLWLVRPDQADDLIHHYLPEAGHSRSCYRIVFLSFDEQYTGISGVPGGSVRLYLTNS